MLEVVCEADKHEHELGIWTEHEWKAENSLTWPILFVVPSMSTLRAPP